MRVREDAETPILFPVKSGGQESSTPPTLWFGFPICGTVTGHSIFNQNFIKADQVVKEIVVAHSAL